jgi:ParB/RepB/Spo0J family partition protein
VLQPILVRPLGPNTYQIVAGERRWRASRQAGLETIPALIEEIDDDTALEIAIIENLQREDLTPLDEAAMFDRMVHEHGYSIRKLADKLGKDKGYLENRLRLADAPPEIRELVSLRKDSLSHAYELMKVEDPKKRRRLAAQVARGELTLIKLRDKIEGRRSRPDVPADEVEGQHSPAAADAPSPVADEGWTAALPSPPVTDDSLMDAKQGLADAVEALVALLRSPELRGQIPATDRANLAKYLTIAKLKLENAIAIVRSDNPDV